MSDNQPDYKLLDNQLEALAEGEPDALANTANFVGLLFQAMPDVNWLGVYVLRGEELVLGPFQGNPACVRIPLGRGVCGTAAANRESLVVDDVEQFPGHIVCDAASRSELVVPLVADDLVLGVLDIDSPSKARFGEADRRGVEALCARFVKILARGGSTPPEFI